MKQTEAKDFELLRDVLREERRNSSFRPWRGMFGRAKKLEKAGYLQETGISAMWPHILYGTTPAGRAALGAEEKGKRA